MGYFTYRNARKAAVRSRRIENTLNEQARREDGSGYQDASELTQDLGVLVFASLVFLTLPLMWLAHKWGKPVAVVVTALLVGLLVLFPPMFLGYLVFCTVLAVTWKDRESS